MTSNSDLKRFIVSASQAYANYAIDKLSYSDHVSGEDENFYLSRISQGHHSSKIPCIIGAFTGSSIRSFASRGRLFGAPR
ncbi:hypothetical protein VNO77_23118 [Canavalia gladiata]|uniref:Uncharacterized protein n=1 Tax=Canavalia gladiata TaxID=3824 RepID=A0AAN9L406_CANGL